MIKRPEPSVTAKSFMSDIKQHQLTVHRCDGVSRHLSFKRPDSSTMGFEIITWPGHLMISGDCGSYVFARLYDMFEFFQTSDKKLVINPGYWEEKLLATDTRCGHRRFSPEKARYLIQQYLFDTHGTKRKKLTAEEKELWAQVESEVLSHIEDGEHALRQAMRDFGDSDVFGDFYWDSDFDEYSAQFLWCCYAVTHIANMMQRGE